MLTITTVPLPQRYNIRTKNDVNITNITTDELFLYNLLSLNGSSSNVVTMLDFSVSPPDEYQDHTVIWTPGPIMYTTGYTGSLSLQGVHTVESASSRPSVTCTRKATPIKFTQPPEIIDFNDVAAHSTQVLTRPLHYNWRDRLYLSILTECQGDDIAEEEKECPPGMWIHDEGHRRFRMLPRF